MVLVRRLSGAWEMGEMTTGWGEEELRITGFWLHGRSRKQKNETNRLAACHMNFLKN